MKRLQKKNVPFGKINVGPRWSSDVNMAHQTKHSCRTWAHHQENIGLSAVA